MALRATQLHEDAPIGGQAPSLRRAPQPALPRFSLRLQRSGGRVSRKPPVDRCRSVLVTRRIPNRARQQAARPVPTDV